EVRIHPFCPATLRQGYIEGVQFLSRVAAAFSFLLIGAAWATAQEPFTLTVIHSNDLHAHAEPVTVNGKSIGGYARLASAILSLKNEAENPLILSAGDTFQGTLYFNTYDGLADLAVMNLIGFQAMAVG